MIEDAYLRDQGGADALEEGFFLLQFRRARRVDIPFRIWFGAPLDPDTGEEMDRSHRWQIEIAGVMFDGPVGFGGISFNSLTDFWPTIARDRISGEEYAFRVARAAWANENDEFDAMGTPGGRIDAMTATLPGL